MQAYVEHYITFGITEGRSSESSFDILAFSKAYPDTGVRSNATPEEVLNSYKAELAKNKVEEKKEEIKETNDRPDEEYVVVYVDSIRPIPLFHVN